MARQILPVVVTSGNVDDTKSRLRAALLGTDQSVQACSAMSDPQRAAWGQFYSSVLAFTRSSSSFWTAAADMNQAQAYEDELVAWQPKVQAAGCELLVPSYDPSKDPARDATVNLIKWVGIAVLAASGAFVVGKVLEVVIEAERVLPEGKRA